jgi:lipopolysaccharide/colanic/teichoic acid biosynthesis glycosyltransferase
MRTDYDKDARGVQVRGNSNAITPIGRFLRKSKLDELPQLLNIIAGHMSFVGPRPELPRRLHHYSKADREVFAVRSGISSPASIILSNEEYLMNSVKNPEDFYITQIMPYKIAVNIFYIRNRCFWGDIKIIFLTLAKLFWNFSDSVVVPDATLLTQKKQLEDLAEQGG